MDTRRSFIKKTAMLSGAAGIAHLLPPSIQKALAINPDPGTTYLDAEHVVLLMQENRSFDHTFGTLRGVRGFNDPRAITLADKNKVWLQTNKAGETYSPFRLNIKDTKITWMGSLPHGRHSQIAAWNNGRHDNWLDAKKSDERGYEKMPLTMGYYTREDIPFYYALADAFTVCDQNFCSSLTGTDPNRLYFWTGTVREKQHEDARPFVQNEDVERGVEWETFPELLEKNGISWKVYQNEIGLSHSFTEEQDIWLGNFGDNVLEYFRQYNVKFSKGYVEYLPKKIASLQDEISKLKARTEYLSPTSRDLEDTQKKIKDKQQQLDATIEEQKIWASDKFENLAAHHKNIHKNAFVTNVKDPFQHQLAPLDYMDENIGREINIPKGDLFHQFREDVQTGKLPTVSWLVAPEYFSDHPSAPWFGSWYVSEAMDILTQNPEVWKKTIFILLYDENDGYFDHVPPFVAPDPRNPATGAVSAGIDTSVEHVRAQQDSPGPIGLGYRVPLMIASPWSRGGFVNSQVFDHTSTLQFLEKFLNKKYGKKIVSEKISQWRRTVCGDLTSVFRPDDGIKIEALPFVRKDTFIEGVYKAKFKNTPINYKKLTKEEIDQINSDAHTSPFMPQQEKGTRPSCALPYELNVDGGLSSDKSSFLISMQVGKIVFKNKSAGSPFTVYAYGKELKIKNYAVAAGDQLFDKTLLNEFEEGNYDIRLSGPNGFLRVFKGNKNDPPLQINFRYEDPNFDKHAEPSYTGRIIVCFINPDLKHRYKIRIVDNAYKSYDPILKDIYNVNENPPVTSITIDPRSSGGWYDFSIFAEGNNVFEKRYAGRVETGKHSITDPLMGGMI
jgi:phospholipase C